MNNVLHSSERIDWQTPLWLLNRVRAVAPIGLDPATSAANPTRARLIATPGGACGLSVEWCGLCEPHEQVWINPPYGRFLPGPIDPAYVHPDGSRGRGWARKIAAYAGNRMALVPNRTEAKWFGDLHDSSHLRMELLKRVSFVNPDTGLPGASPNHGSVIFVRGDRDYLEDAITMFQDIARIIDGPL